MPWVAQVGVSDSLPSLPEHSPKLSDPAELPHEPPTLVTAVKPDTKHTPNTANSHPAPCWGVQTSSHTPQPSFHGPMLQVTPA